VGVNFHVLDRVVPYAGLAYLRTLSSSKVVAQNPALVDFAFAKVGAQLIFGDLSADLSYVRPLDSPGIEMGLNVFSGGISYKM
jgi:hypothetical protein